MMHFTSWVNLLEMVSRYKRRFFAILICKRNESYPEKFEHKKCTSKIDNFNRCIETQDFSSYCIHMTTHA